MILDISNRFALSRKIPHRISFETISSNTLMEESINTDNYLQEFSCRATVRAELKNSFGIEELNIAKF